ncbi:MAG: hypothetical protein EXX96DRAFT_645511 [Benjaminiella poitrasii]|nr:MAG: hypothetical protein EXX96DRAFT_645511 [Benjaminiella poitrasii]
MDKTLIDYDKNLEELERQREKLEIVMQMMGQEWEESGPGIGWLGQLDLPAVNAELEGSSSIPSTTVNETSLNELANDIIPESNILSRSIPLTSTSGEPSTTPVIPPLETTATELSSSSSDMLKLTHEPLFPNILSQTGPSPEYLQSLLNVNEALLAQSLANNPSPSTPLLTPIEDQMNDMLLDTSAKLNSPLITPKEDNETPNDDDSLSDFNNTPLDYMGSINPESEKIVSPLTATSNKPFKTTTTTTTTTTVASSTGSEETLPY